MALADLALTLVNALSWAMATFLVASGLTLVFGILHVLNFAHGGFFMIGAYVSFTLIRLLGGEATLVTYLGAAIVATVVVGLLGWLVDRFVLRRLRNVDGAYVLIATYALLLLCEGATKMIWGLDFHAMQPPAPLDSGFISGPLVVPTFSLFVIAVGIIAFLVLEWVLSRTAVGRLVQGVAMDPWAARLLGVNVTRVFAGCVVVGFALAGLAGGLLLANQSLSPALAGSFVMQAFGVIIVGGMGSISGAFLGALMLGLIDSINTWVLPELPGVMFFMAMAIVLLIRPRGLFGQERIA